MSGGVSTRIDPDPFSYSLLWRAVLARALTDAAYKRSPADRTKASLWIRTDDFEEVSESAGLDPKLTREVFQVVLAAPGKIEAVALMQTARNIFMGRASPRLHVLELGRAVLRIRRVSEESTR